MAIKISNEAKVGTLVIISLAILILGFNFLRGKGVFSTDIEYHTFYDDVSGLQEAASVELQGLKIGKVSAIELQPDRTIKVIFILRKDIVLPEGARVQMAFDNILAGTKNLALLLPESGTGTAKPIEKGSFVPSVEASDIMSNITENISPILGTANKAVSSIDSILLSLNSIVNEEARLHINKSLAHLENSMADLSKLAHALSSQSGSIAGLLNNMNSITSNLSKSNNDISTTLNNLNEFSGQLKDAPLQQTIDDLQKTVANLNSVLSQANNPDGSIGLMLNDPALYNNLTVTLKSLDALITDLNKHPSRYINISVFGRKDRSQK